MFARLATIAEWNKKEKKKNNIYFDRVYLSFARAHSLALQISRMRFETIAFDFVRMFNGSFFLSGRRNSN